VSAGQIFFVLLDGARGFGNKFVQDVEQALGIKGFKLPGCSFTARSGDWADRDDREVRPDVTQVADQIGTGRLLHAGVYDSPVDEREFAERLDGLGGRIGGEDVVFCRLEH